MARIVPSDLTRLRLSGAHEPEVETLALLRDGLPNDYTVFHGVHWTRQTNAGNVRYGEIDFVVVNRSGSVLCIEQKNGPLEEHEGGLYKRYGSASKNVIERLQKSLDAIREQFRDQTGGTQGLNLQYLVYCANHTVRRLLSSALDRRRVVDAPRREDLAAAIQATLPQGSPDARGHAQAVQAFFRQTFEVVPDVHAHQAAQERQFTRLSSGLVEVLDNIQLRPLRLHVLATAGNGKTLVASHFYRQALDSGRRPLLLCFNRPLAERLAHRVPAGGRVSTWYGFCDDFLKSRGVALDYEAMQGDPQFWAKAARQVGDAALARTPVDDWRFDTLIIDEAQDFEAEWLEIVDLFLRDGADLLWLEDPNQNVRGTERVPLDQRGFVGYQSMRNYRSPEGIATFIQRALPEFPFTGSNDLPGLGVGIRAYEKPEEQPAVVADLVTRLRREGFEARDITILSCRGRDSTLFKDRQRVGNYTLSRFTGEYDLFGNQVVSPGQVRFDTVRRFKGQQGAAIILVDVDPREEHLDQELRVLYCGMTRATVRLEVVCNGTSGWVQERILSSP